MSYEVFSPSIPELFREDITSVPTSFIFNPFFPEPFAWKSLKTGWAETPMRVSISVDILT